MKKLFGILIIAVALVFATNNTASAQQSFGSAGLEVAIPMGDFADSGANFGIGGSGTFEIGLSDNFSVLAQAGVLFYATDDFETEVFNPITSETTTVESDYSITQIPLQVGGRFYLSEQKEGLYLAGLVGVHITSSSIEDESDSSTDLSFAPELGFFLSENISVALRYQFITAEEETIDLSGNTETENVTNSYLGLRAAYNF